MPYVGNTVNILRPGTPYQVPVATGLAGLNNSISDELIDDQELSDVSNYVIDLLEAGVLVKREGSTKEVTTALTEAGTSVYDGVQNDYFTTSTKIFSFNGTERVSGLTTATEAYWTSYNGNDIYTDGVNAPQTSSNGTSFAALGGSPPTFKYVDAYANLVFGAGHSAGILRWSAFGNQASWPAVNALTLTNNADDDIVGLKKYQNVLVVFCEKSFYHIQSLGNEIEVSVSYANFEEGCTSGRSIIGCPYGLFWWSKNGPVWSPDGHSLKYIGKHKIPQTIDNLNRGQYGLIHGIWNPIHERVEWWVFNGTSTTVNRKIYFYPERQAFFVGEGAGVEMGAAGVLVRSGVPRVYVTSASTSGYFYEQTGSSDDGTVISAYLETKRQAPAGPTGLVFGKRMTPLFILEGNPTITYSVYLDNADTISKSYILTPSASGFILDVSLLDVGILGASTEANETEVTLARRYRKIKHRIADSAGLRTRIRGIANEGYILRT